MRRVDLPSQFFVAEKVRLGMRLPAVAALHTSLQRAAPAGVKIVRYGEAPSASASSWAKVIAAAGDRPTEEAAAEQWQLEFAAHDAELRKRMYFAIDETDGAPIGTATAWLYTGRPAQREARVHWVSVVPRAQGRGLAKVLLGAVVQTGRALHAEAENFCLVTHTQAARAISMYLQVGFVPTGLGPDNQTPDGRSEMTDEELAGWAAMREAGLELPE